MIEAWLIWFFGPTLWKGAAFVGSVFLWIVVPITVVQCFEAYLKHERSMARDGFKERL